MEKEEWHHFLYTPVVCWIHCFGFPDSQPVDKVEAQVTAAHTPLRPFDDWDLQSYEVMLFNATRRSVLKKCKKKSAEYHDHRKSSC